MSAQRVQRRLWIAPASSPVIAAGTVVLFDLLSAREFESQVGFAAAMIPFGAVGALVVARRPDNVIGRLLIVVAFVAATVVLSTAYATSDPPFVGRRWAAWVASSVLPLAFGSLILMIQLFPDGMALSPRWRAGIWLTALGGIALSLGMALTPGRLPNFPAIRNPMGVEGIVRTPLGGGGIGWALLPVAVLVAAASVVVRFRRSRGERRQQIKWLAFAASLLAVAWLLIAFVEGGKTVGDVLLALAIVGLPVAVGVAVLKYRLYDIDLVINKTLVYGSLAAFITAVYVGVVVGIGSAVGRGDQPNLGLSILATAVVAVAFQPVQERIQHLANRLVYGRRATPYEVLSRFSKGLAGTSGLEDLLSRLVRLLAEGTGAKNAQVWLRVSEHLVCEAAWSPDGEHPQPIPHRGDGDPVIPAAGRVVPVRHQGELLGVVALTKAPGDPITPGDDKLLADVASQAGLVLRNVRLVEDLRASRQRIVAAQDEERRRLERDVHDGAQQQLVALALGIRMAETRLGGATNPRLGEALERADQELKETLSELRELARGIHPAILTERGLEPALRMLVERSPVPVDVESSLNTRLPPTVEATAYFVVAEALQNVAKYSGASAATVRVDASAGELRVEVSDDGVGGADASRGSGLRGLMDRVAAVDGVLEVESAPGRGTRLTCRIPVRSRLQPTLMRGEASESVQGAEGESVGEPALR